MNRQQRRKAIKEQQKKETALRLLGIKRIKSNKYLKNTPDKEVKKIVQNIISNSKEINE